MVRIAEETDPEILRQAALLLDAENRRLIELNVRLQREIIALKGLDPATAQLKIELLEQQLAQARQSLFGRSSERREGEESQPAPGPAPRKPQRGHGPTEQPQLPIVEEPHILDEAERTCDSCGGALLEWDGQFEEFEEIDVLERQFVLRKHKRQKYRCHCGACIKTAPPPLKLFEGARYSIRFGVDVAVEKYIDHMPLERQVRTMDRDGLTTTSQTLWDYLEAQARLLQPAYERLWSSLTARDLLGADETRWHLLGKKGQDEGPANWQVWALCSNDAVYYRIEDSRSTRAAHNLLGGFKGTLMVDGYHAYEAVARQSGAGVRLVFCWAHVRRKFVEIESFYPAECKQIIGLIRELYAVEDECPEGRQGDDLRRLLRRERSRAILDRISEWVFATYPRQLPESTLAKAIKYMGSRWVGLTRFIDDPCVPLDNNATERVLRSVVVGRKNHYGSKSRRGTEVAALYYSLLESAKLAGLEPRGYLLYAVLAALRREPIKLPHELAAEAAAKSQPGP